MHRLHPLAAVQMFQNRWVLLLTPFVRALFLWQPEAFWLALQQDAFLLCALLTYTYFAWRNNGWCYQNAPSPHLQLHRGLLLRQQLCIAPSQITLLCLAHSLPLHCIGAKHLLLYYKAPTHARQNAQPIRLTVSRADADLLLCLLLPHSATPTAALPRQTLRRRSLFAFVWRSGLLFLMAGFGWLLSLSQNSAIRLSLLAVTLFYAVQLGMSVVGFCTEGIWQNAHDTTLCTQEGGTLWRFYLPGNLPPFRYAQSPFARRAGRASLTLYPIKGKSLRIRSVLLKSFTPFIGKD